MNKRKNNWTPAKRKRQSKRLKAVWAARSKSHKMKSRWASLTTEERQTRLQQLERARATRIMARNIIRKVSNKTKTTILSTELTDIVADKIAEKLIVRMFTK